MARKADLRKQRTGTVINVTSKKQESEIIQALFQVEQRLRQEYGDSLILKHESTWSLYSIVEELRRSYPEVDFHYHFRRSSIRPDGGILCMMPLKPTEISYPILISEAKNQGTNDLRRQEGLAKQAKGNAIERLGKNVIGLRTALMRESIFPFVCFGYGCDFAPDSSILDRVTTIAMFGHLNKTYLHDQEAGRFDRGSFYFREQIWTVAEMAAIMTDIAVRSVMYYFSKYGKEHFVQST
jgi:type II restriction enzyme